MRNKGLKRWEEIKVLLPYVKALRINGADEAEAAGALGISYATYKRYKKLYPELKEAVEVDKEKADIAVQTALLKSATGYTVKVKKAFKLKDVHYDERGKKIEKERLELFEEEQAVPPNLSAQTYWLKNRCPKMWNDAREEDEKDSGIVILPEVNLMSKGEQAEDEQ